MNGPVPLDYPSTPLNRWRKRENGPWRGVRRDAAENSNVPVARSARDSKFVASAKAKTEEFSLFRRHPESARKALAVMRPDLGIDDPRRAFAVERAKDLLGGDAAHVLARLAGDTGSVRARQHVVELQQGMLGRRRLPGPDVEAGARDALFLQGLQQCVLVMDEAARGGDEEGVRLHQRELPRADHAAALFGQWAVDRDIVGAPQQIVEPDLRRAPRRDLVGGEIGIVGQHLHAEQPV